MTRHLSRRTVLRAASIAAIAHPVASRAAVQQNVSSGGLGLSRPGIEALYGQGQPGQSFMVYTEPAYGVDLHIGYEGDLVDYVWLSLGDEQAWTGTPLDDAWTLAASLLPSDARLRESYSMQETPGSMGQVETMRYTSRWLDETMDGRSSILVTITSYPLGAGPVATRGSIQLEQR